MEPLTRPAPARSMAERARGWIDWFGIGRLVAASVATLIVFAGAVWLLRAPAPTVESSLPRATTSGVPVATSSPIAAASSTIASEVTVHVAGAVIEPGVYALGPGARVRDAIVAAGGPTDTADSNALNLAAPIADGAKVYVPSIGEEVPPSLTAPAVAPAAPTVAGPVDVNVASAEELDTLPGVGPATAAAIVAERERGGPFVDVEDLDRVPGIGPAKLEVLRDLVTT